MKLVSAAIEPSSTSVIYELEYDSAGREMLKKIAFPITLLILLSAVLPATFNIKLELDEKSYENGHYEVAKSSLASTSTPAEVRFDPETYPFISQRGIGAGYRFNTTIELYDVTQLFAWQIRVYFNNTLLNVTGGYYHPDEPLSTVGGYPLSPVVANNYNATHGYVQHGISALYPNHVNVTKEDYPLGLGICIVEYQIIAEPASGRPLESTLSINNTDTNLVKDPSTTIPCTKKNGLYRLVSANIRVPTVYLTIQEAINAANLGDTVFVYNGTYYENVVVNKTLTLAGQSAATTIVNGSGGTVMYVEEVDDVTIDGFTICSGGSGIYVRNSQRGTISGNNITRNDKGIYGHSQTSGSYTSGQSDYWTVFGNNITRNSYGIYGRSSSGHFMARAYVNSWVIYNNFITECIQGIYVSYAGSYERWTYIDNWMIRDNLIESNQDHGIYGDLDGGPGRSRVNGWYIYRNNVTRNDGYGIYVNAYNAYEGHAHGDYWTIRENIINANSGGIYSIGVTQYDGNVAIYGWIVRNNTVNNNNGPGIYLGTHADTWTIYGNEVRNCTQGMHLGDKDNVLRENTLSYNDYNFGVSFSYIQDVDTSNTVNGKPIYYLINRWGAQIPMDAGYIALVDSGNMTLENFNLSHNEQGIILIRTRNVTLKSICASSSIHGLYLQASMNFTLDDCQAMNNTYGIFVEDASSFTIHNNQAKNNTYGLYLQGSVESRVSGNRLSNNTCGIHLESSGNCTVNGNDVEENGYGVHLEGSSNNTFYHNNFDQNNQQIALEETVVNVWNIEYPSGGNYWSDQAGPDWFKGISQNETGSDGIVDENMTINGDNIDYYPLSSPWSSPIRIVMPGSTMYRGTNITMTFSLDFSASWIGYSLDSQENVTIVGNINITDLSYGRHHIIVYANDTSGNMWSSVKVHFAITYITDINYDQTVDIDDLVEATWRYGSVPGDPRWNAYADVNQDGIIDIEDIALVATDYGKTWP